MAEERSNRTSIRRHVLDGSILVFFAEGLFPLTGIITAAFLSRSLGANGYGLLSLSVFLAMLFMSTSGALFTKSLINTIRNEALWQPVATRAIQCQLVVSGATMVVVWVLAVPIASALNTVRLVWLIRLLAVGVPIHNLTLTYQRILTGRGGYRQRALTGALRSIARLVLIILLVELGLSVEGAILGIVGSWVVELLFLIRAVRVPVLKRSLYRVRDMADYVAPLFIASIFSRVFHQADLVLIKALEGTSEQVGLYAAAQNLSMVPTLLIGAVTPLVLSSVSEMKKKHGAPAAQGLAADAMRLTILLTPFAALAAGAAPGIVGFIYGSGFAASGPLLRVLLLATVGLMLVHLCTAMLTVSGFPRLVLYLAAGMMVVAVGGHLLLIPRYGSLGAAWVTTGVAWVGAVVGLGMVGHKWSVHLPLGTLIRCGIMAPVAYWLPIGWSVTGVWVVPQLLLFVLLIAGAMLLTGELHFRELMALRTLFSRRDRQESADEPV